MIRAAISQSNYIPWKGYFDMIASVDAFVIYDDMQYTKRDWRNRNLIKTPQGLRWLSIPVEVSGKYFQKIKDTRIADKSWSRSHWAILEVNYKGSPFFQEVAEWLKPLYLNCDLDYLSEVNVSFLGSIMDYLGIRTPLRMSSEFFLEQERSERLAGICQQIGADHYVSGPAAKAYMDLAVFETRGIEVSYFDYAGYPEYTQQFPPFEHGVSILDLCFNVGAEAKNYMKFIV
jgi:hypothetical protein